MLVTIDEVFSIHAFQVVDKIRHRAAANDSSLEELMEVERQFGQEFRFLPSLIGYRWAAIRLPNGIVRNLPLHVVLRCKLG